MEKFIWSCQPFGSYSFPKKFKKKTGNYMRGSTVPCPILCMCLLSSYIVNVWIGVVIYHQELRSFLVYEIGEEQGEPLAWRIVNVGLLNIFEEIPWEWVLSDRLLFSTRHLIFQLFCLTPWSLAPLLFNKHSSPYIACVQNWNLLINLLI
jgi:hypothetical protein